ncbi:MAG: DUF819 family protein [Bacteroidales bacterium]|nr:DUF819 family protein [Bacteroidales bacterium]
MYVLGLLLGNMGLFPNASDAYLHLYNLHGTLSPDLIAAKLAEGHIASTDAVLNSIKKTQDILLTISIPVAIPLLLFSTSIGNFLRIARKMLLSSLIAIFSVILFVAAGYFLLKNKGIPQLWKVGGMLVGLYTGGTPNLASLKIMLDVDANTYILTHTYDTLVSAVYLLFLITFGKNMFRWLLNSKVKAASLSSQENTHNQPIAARALLKKDSLKNVGRGLLISVLIVGLAGGLSMLFDKQYQMLTVILAITSLSLAASAIKKIRETKYTYELGMYFILVFSFVVASMADVRVFVDHSPLIIEYITFTIFGSLFLHVLLSKIFKVDAESLIICSTALVCSPPFVPMMAHALKNRQLIASGLAVGVLGYAIGNYLGVTLAFY